MRFVALLRGINVGGNKRVEMGKLKAMMESLGFSAVVTLLNSGNVVFSSNEENPSHLQKIIEEEIEKTFGFPVQTIIRSEKEIKKLIESDPFHSIPVKSDTRLYISFLARPVKTNLSIPFTSSDKALQILQLTDSEIISVVTVSEQKNTTDVMKLYEKEFGKDQTMRNWNTVEKIAAKL